MSSEIKRVKVGKLVESQIPSYLNEESNLFREFLELYYYSQEHQSGVLDLANNIPNYIKGTFFNRETLIPYAVLLRDITFADNRIIVNSTTGWPDEYGLLKIDDEIITYTRRTQTTFEDCFRGFSGIDQISKDADVEFLNFSATDAEKHDQGSIVYNLSNLFLQEIFTKFKSQFLPGFENRKFTEGVNLASILSRAKDFYTAKGTDTSYKLLFKILFNEDIDIIKPQEYTLVPSDNEYFVTKNVLVEKIFGAGDPIFSKGNFLFQNISGIGTVSASIYNVEYRPINGKDFYEISLDSSSFDGKFRAPGKTKIIENTPINSATILVDSTIGFQKSGNLLIKPTPTSEYIKLTYRDKTINQFLGVTGINTTFLFGADVSEDNLAYAYVGLGQTSKVDLRLVNVIDEVSTTETSNMRVGDTLMLSSFGFDLIDDPKFSTWVYNVPTKHRILSVVQQNQNTFRIQLYDSVIFSIGEELFVLNNRNQKIRGTIRSVEFPPGDTLKLKSDTIIVQLVGSLPSNPYQIEKIIVKATHNSNYFPGLSDIAVGVQNSYLDFDEKNMYVASSGIANYPIFATDNKIFIITGSNSDGIVSIINSIDPLNRTPFRHNLVTGDKLYWNNSTNSGLSTGIYFVTSINEFDFRLSFSNSDVFSNKYISVRSNLPGQYVFKSGWENKNAVHQKLLAKFPYQKEVFYFDDESKRSTANRPIGLSANGVELYPSTVFEEKIFFGKLDSILVTNPGRNFDVINGPPLVIQDDLGFGAKAYANIVGSFKEIKLVTPGIGYQEKPKITVSGGNGKGAVLESNLVRGRIVVPFKADGTSVNVSSDTIDFPIKHNFELGEEIIYDSGGNPPIAGIVDDSSYFARPVDPFTISLHTTPKDARSGINTVNIGSVSTGFHNFKTLNSKNTITKIYVKDPGSGYSNKKIVVPSRPTNRDIQSGINTSDNYFFAQNHKFESGEIVIYECTGTVANGLSTTTEYFVHKINEDKFRLSDAGLGTTRTSENYSKKKYVRISGVGTGNHTIRYPSIRINVETLAGISSAGIVRPEIEPVVLGSVESVYVEDFGVGYGCTNIVNFHRRPNVGISTVTIKALLKPIIINGTIVDIQILARGSGYRKDSEIVIFDNTERGNFAQILPIIKNGKLQSVRIIDGGLNYSSDTTYVELRNRGTDAKFLANVNSWTINQNVKSQSIINSEDTLLTKPNDNGLQFIALTLSNKLRYQLSDNIDSANIELVNNPSHSPILGWAYDGNPIYGPYGFSAATGGPIRRILSSYELDISPKIGLRPPGFAPGYFTNDYYFNSSGDLDASNGRYCITPEFPNGTYAYFYTIDIDSSGVSNPKYPYLVGNYFKDRPLTENFDSTFTQDLNLSDFNLIRNVGPYYLNNRNSSYDVIDKVTKESKQEFTVTKIKTSGISSVTIFSQGSGYRVGELLNLDNEGTDGTGTNIVVSHVAGKSIDIINVGVSTVTNIQIQIVNNRIIGISTDPHNFVNGETIIVSGVSTSKLSSIEGSYRVSVISRSVGLSQYLPSASVTGISTFINVSDTRGFFVNDVIGIGTEVLRVTSIDEQFSRLGVNRQVGVSLTHPTGTNNVILLPTRFEYTVENAVKYPTYENKVVYFNPKFTIGLGTTGTNYRISATGIGSTSTETIINRFVREQSIYIKNHPYYTGQQLKYNAGIGGSTIVYSSTGYGSTSGIGTQRLLPNSTVYAINLGVDYLGISTVGFPTVGNAVYFFPVGAEVGTAHSFTTTFDSVSIVAEKYKASIKTTAKHNLVDGDLVSLTSLPQQVETVKLRYDPILLKITSETVSFSSTTFSNDLTSFKIDTQKFNNGDKVVYYSSTGNIGGLVNNEVYYVLKEDPDRIKLCRNFSDVAESKAIVMSSVSLGSYSLAKINPPVLVNRGNRLEFDISDQSLSSMRLDFYEDINFRNRLDITGTSEFGFSIFRDGIPGTVGAKVIISTVNQFPKKSFYNLTPITPTDERKNQITSDDSVPGRNSITVKDSILSGEHAIIVSDGNNFSFNLLSKPAFYENFITKAGLATVYYETTSPFAVGPVSRTKINFKGKGYSRLPKVLGFDTISGKDAVIKINSNKIGQVETFERIKDGFDYPTDPTLLPFLSVPTVCDISGISRIDRVDITDGGINYQQPPTLIVPRNRNIKLRAVVNGGSVTNVLVLQNENTFTEPLQVLSTRNSNGYDIDTITHTGNLVTLELLLDPQFNRPITVGYGSSVIDFPFEIGDRVYVEGCRLTPSSRNAGELNFNSEDYSYRFFDVVGVNTTNFTVTYNMAGIATGTLGQYDDDFTLGYVVNEKHLAKFDMKIIDDSSYISGERVTSRKFTARVSENGYDSNLNQLRLFDSIGELRVGDILVGEQSKLRGKVEAVNRFNVKTKLGITRDKVGQVDKSRGILNEYLQRISDNFYYQKFSYSINSKIPYDKWRESVRSIIHPSGFREFSDLKIFGDPKRDAIVNNYVNVGLAKSINMKVRALTQNVKLIINIDNEISFTSRSNFAMVTEDDPLEDGGVQRIFFPESRPLRGYILNKTNKVLNLDDISNGFSGRLDRAGNLIGNTNFKLTTKSGVPVFKATFNSASSSIVDLTNNIISIPNHNFQSGQELIYSTQGGSVLGIATTSHTSGSRTIVMSVTGAGGSALFENGYNSSVVGPIIGVSTTANPIVGAKLFGFGTGIPGISTFGTGAKFEVLITYSQSTGVPLSTSILLRQGGYGYKVGETVSIAGTFIGGTNPTNNLSFVVTKVASTRVGIQTVYSNLPATTNGSGTGATFDVERDVNYDISRVSVVTGGTGYANTETISIAGTYIGGSTPIDNLYLTPTELGRNTIPSSVYVQKIDDVKFRLAGLSTSLAFNITGLGTGTHLLTYPEPNENALILVDGIIQSPVKNKKLSVTVTAPISPTDQQISVGAGINSISTGDLIKIDNEYVRVNFIGKGSFVVSRTAEPLSEVDTNFYYDTNRMNSNVTTVDTTIVTADDRPPY